MTLHYYGKLDTLESCYTFQKFELDGKSLYIQNSPRFGYEPATMSIKSPALFVEDKTGFHRYVIEEFEIEVVDGVLNLGDDDLRHIQQASIYRNN